MMKGNMIPKYYRYYGSITFMFQYVGSFETKIGLELELAGNRILSISFIVAVTVIQFNC